MSRRRLPAATAALLMGDEPLEPAARPKRKTRATAPSEAAVVSAIKARLALYGCIVQANPNEARSALLGVGSKIRNTVTGFPDLTVIGPAGRAAFLEVKAPGARPRDAKQKAHWERQAEVREMLARMGHITGLVRSQDEAADMLRAAGWPVR